MNDLVHKHELSEQLEVSVAVFQLRSKLTLTDLSLKTNTTFLSRINI